MTIRFQADADFNQNIVTGVLRREPTIDFQTASAVSLEGLEDRDVLGIAAKEGRILVSHDCLRHASRTQNDAVVLC